MESLAAVNYFCQALQIRRLLAPGYTWEPVYILTIFTF